jgi:arylsulfatase A-like enzyme
VYDFDDEKRFVVDGYDWEPTWHTDLVLDFAKRNRDAGKSWLYFASYGPPHKPQQCPPAWLDRYPIEDLELNPLQKRNNKNQAKKPGGALYEALQVYLGQVSAVDHEVGRLRQGLEDLGVAEDTIVIYTADHGDVLGSRGKLRGKCEPYAMASRIPCMIAGPGIAPARSGLPVSGIDLAPTILELVGLEVPASMAGTSLAGLCRGGAAPEMDVAFMHLGKWDAIFDGRHLYAPQHRACFDWQEDRFELENLWDDAALRATLDGKYRAKLAAIGAQPAGA